MKLDENSIIYYQSTYILPSFRKIVSYKGFLQKSKNQETPYLFKIQHRILDKKIGLENWIKDTINVASKGDLEKNIYKYLKNYYENNLD